MNRSVTVLLTCVFAVFFVAGSVSAGKVWETGLKVGMSYFNLVGDETSFTDYKAGLSVGGFVMRKIHNNVGVQAEVLYTMKGGKDASKLTELPNKYTLTYLEIPVLAKVVLPHSADRPKKPSYRSVGGEGLTPGFYVGPVVAINLNAEYTIADSARTVDVSCVNTIDYGLALGGGFDSALPKGRMLFDLRFTFGLSKIFDMDPSPNVRNSGVTFMLGYIF